MKRSEYEKMLSQEETMRRLEEIEKLWGKLTTDELIDAIMDPFGASDDIKTACAMLMFAAAMNERQAAYRIFKHNVKAISFQGGPN